MLIMVIKTTQCAKLIDYYFQLILRIDIILPLPLRYNQQLESQQ